MPWQESPFPLPKSLDRPPATTAAVSVLIFTPKINHIKQTNDQTCNRQKHLHSMSKAAQIRIIQTPTKLPNSPLFKTALVKIWGFEAAEGQQQKTSQDRLLL